MGCSQAGGKKAAEPFIMQLDVEVAAPVIVIPRRTDSEDHMRVHLGALNLVNEVSRALPAAGADGKVSRHAGT